MQNGAPAPGNQRGSRTDAATETTCVFAARHCERSHVVLISKKQPYNHHRGCFEAAAACTFCRSEGHDEEKLRENGSEGQDAADRAPRVKGRGASRTLQEKSVSLSLFALRRPFFSCRAACFCAVHSGGVGPWREERLHEPGLCRDLPAARIQVRKGVFG